MAKKQPRNDAGPKDDTTSKSPAKPSDAVDLPETQFQERVSEKAYELFQRRGGEPGHDMEDWLEAERLIRGDLGEAPHTQRKSKPHKNPKT